MNKVSLCLLVTSVVLIASLPSTEASPKTIYRHDFIAKQISMENDEKSLAFRCATCNTDCPVTCPPPTQPTPPPTHPTPPPTHPTPPPTHPTPPPTHPTPPPTHPTPYTHPTHPTPPPCHDCHVCPPIHKPPTTKYPNLPSITFSTNCDFCDHDLYTLTCVETKFDCASRCAVDMKCSHFTYIANLNGGTCHLKKAFGSGGAWASSVSSPSPYVCGYIPSRALIGIFLNVCVGLDITGSVRK